MGIELIENFRFPYVTRTPQEFWRHWHISLSTWLRDYLYIPLGGNRGSEARTRRNLLITMVLGGLWHGAAWTFVLWGMYHGLLLIAYRAASQARFSSHWLASRQPVARLLGWALMFHLTCFGWLLFRARSAGQAANLTSRLFMDFSPATLDPTLAVPLLLYVVPLLVIHACEAWADDVLVVRRLPAGVRYSVYASTFYLTMLFGNFGGSDFIYFQF
jgi:D-alanyl-lipoteichoic acid acyltransferase DltB (MBOAT superfamily)